MEANTKPTKSNMKKLIIISILIFSTFFISATEFTIVAKQGVIRLHTAVVSLVAKDSISFFELDLPDGKYLYISNDKDSCIIEVVKEDVTVSNNNVTIIK